MSTDTSMCGSGIKVAFLDGAVVEVRETTFSRCLVSAAHKRVADGASTYHELTVDELRTKALNVPVSGPSGADEL